MTPATSSDPPEIVVGAARGGPRWQATRARILGAAERLFSEQGYAPVTIEEVVQAAETTRATFYKHFSARAPSWRS